MANISFVKNISGHVVSKDFQNFNKDQDPSPRYRANCNLGHNILGPSCNTYTNPGQVGLGSSRPESTRPGQLGRVKSALYIRYSCIRIG